MLVLIDQLNWAATLLSTHALEKADASLVSPLLTFNPAFTLLIAWFTYVLIGLLENRSGVERSVSSCGEKLHDL